MAKAFDRPPRRMTVDEFIEWAMLQPGGRYELMDGEVVAMAPERAAHARLRARIWRALDDDVRERGLPCEALPDGMTVQIDEHTVYEPDALIHCGDPLPDETVVVPEPLIVVEVLSPRTSARDVGAKLADYFRVPSIRHYLIARTDRPTIIHHEKSEGGEIATHIVTAGAVQLDPPGLSLQLDRIYG
jgi:Uma2 family endonuclease